MKLNTLILGLACSTAAAQEIPADAKPDLLFICFDQLSALALGEGNTPTIDALAARGSTFTAVVTCPLCIPSRASFWSGLLPHRTGIVNGNPPKPVSPWPADRPALGRALSAAGYTCTHLGKTHDVGSLDGFTRVPLREEPTESTHPAWPLAHDSRRDTVTLREALASLAAPPPNGPRCLAIDLCNPHDICNWIGNCRAGTCRVDPPVPLPALRPNHAADDPATLPRPLQYLCCEHSRQGADHRLQRHRLAALPRRLPAFPAPVG